MARRRLGLRRWSNQPSGSTVRTALGTQKWKRATLVLKESDYKYKFFVRKEKRWKQETEEIITEGLGQSTWWEHFVSVLH